MDVEPIKLFKALGDGTRLQIISELQQKPLSVSELVEKMQKSQPAVSIALQKLASASVVLPQKQGTTTIYTLNPKVKQLLRVVGVIA